MATAQARLAEAYEAFEAVAPEWDAARFEVFTFRNIAGIQMTKPRWQVFRHIVNHGTYHRGQIANMLRQLGVKPPSTNLFVLGRLVARWPRSQDRPRSFVRASELVAGGTPWRDALTRCGLPPALAASARTPTIAPVRPARRTARRAPEKDPHRLRPGVRAARADRAGGGADSSPLLVMRFLRAARCSPTPADVRAHFDLRGQGRFGAFRRCGRPHGGVLGLLALLDLRPRVAQGDGAVEDRAPGVESGSTQK